MPGSRPLVRCLVHSWAAQLLQRCRQGDLQRVAAEVAASIVITLGAQVAMLSSHSLYAGSMLVPSASIVSIVITLRSQVAMLSSHCLYAGSVLVPGVPLMLKYQHQCPSQRTVLTFPVQPAVKVASWCKLLHHEESQG